MKSQIRSKSSPPRTGIEAGGVVAVFDFDGTLTFCDTLLAFLRRVAGRGRFWAGLVGLLPVLLCYRLGIIGAQRAKEALLRRFLKGMPVATLRDQVEDFVTAGIGPLVNPEAIDRLRAHQRQGHRIIIISASPELYMARWARELGVDTVAASHLEVREGVLTGRLDGRNCRGPEKLVRLEAILGSLSGHEIHAYGDSSGDRELLAAAQHPVYRPFRERTGFLGRLAIFARALF